MTEPLLAPVGALAVCGGGIGVLVALRDLAGRRARWRSAAHQIVEDPANAAWATTIGLAPSVASPGRTGPYDWSLEDREGTPCPPRSS